MNCSTPNTITPPNSEACIRVPCGKCIPCLGNKRNDWSYRLEQEYKSSKSAIFVTLTYDQKHYPNDGSLDKKHVQNYLKRLRKRDVSGKIRYYAVGEYGSKSGRAHYHALLFNCSEEHARKAWCDSKQNPIGIVHIGKVTEASIAYCTKYILQPELATGKLQKPFSLMSRAYGIGAKYLTDEMVEWHRENEANYIQRYGQKGRLPRFYREKIWPTITAKVQRSTGEKIPLTGIQNLINTRLQYLKTRVSESAKKLVLDNERKENEYWKESHGTNWERAKAESRNAVIERVKTKIAFTQKF